MYALRLISLLPNAIAGVVGREQILLGPNNTNRNITLTFDDLHTNSSGIGYHPTSHKHDSLQYNGLYFESFTVKNVAKALPELRHPIDILCASSAPNALFASRVKGHPWPRFSLHDLTLGPRHPHENTTFNMRSITISPTGSIPGSDDDFIVILTLTLMKLPSGSAYDDFPPDIPWPGLINGDPGYPFGRRVFQLSAFFGPGAHQSIKVDYERLKEYWHDYGEGVDVMELSGELIRNNRDTNDWEVAGDWEVCIDDVAVETVEANGSEGDEKDREWVKISVDAFGKVVDVQRPGMNPRG